MPYYRLCWPISWCTVGAQLGYSPACLPMGLIIYSKHSLGALLGYLWLDFPALQWQTACLPSGTGDLLLVFFGCSVGVLSTMRYYRVCWRISWCTLGALFGYSPTCLPSYSPIVSIFGLFFRALKARLSSFPVTNALAYFVSASLPTKESVHTVDLSTLAVSLERYFAVCRPLWIRIRRCHPATYIVIVLVPRLFSPFLRRRRYFGSNNKTFCGSY